MSSLLKTVAFQCHICDWFTATGHTPFQSPCTKPHAPSQLLKSLVLPQLQHHLGQLRWGRWGEGADRELSARTVGVSGETKEESLL